MEVGKTFEGIQFARPPGNYFWWKQGEWSINGSQVLKWNDIVGGNHLISSGVSLFPLYNSDAAGNGPAILMGAKTVPYANGRVMFLSRPIPTSDPFTSFTVLKVVNVVPPPIGTAVGGFTWFDNGGRSFLFYNLAAGGQLVVTDNYGSTVFNFDNNNLPNVFLITTQGGNGSTQNCRINGIEMNVLSTGSGTPFPYNNIPSSMSDETYFYEMVWVKEYLGEGEMVEWETYLLNKFNLP